MLLQLAEHLRRLLEPLWRQFLLADHEHMVPRKGVIQFGVRRRIKIIRQVDPPHLGTSMTSQWRDSV